MADRITVKHLHVLATRLNKETGSPEQAYVKNEATGKYEAQIGCYHIGSAHGGWSLQRITNAGGAVSDEFHNGPMTARDLYNRMHALLRGIELGRELERAALLGAGWKSPLSRDKLEELARDVYIGKPGALANLQAFFADLPKGE